MSNIKKVFLMAYCRQNLGDDLFIQILLNKYTNIDFFIQIPKFSYLEKLAEYKNLHIIEGEDTDQELSKIDIKKYDAYIYIGGSIFIEGGKVYNLSEAFYQVLSKCKKNNIPFFYMSCNYGPYETEEYFDLSKKAFSTCTDICFRDRYSYNLFKDMETVRYAPDFAFMYKYKNTNKIANSIGISVIDLSIRKEIKHKEKEYMEFLTENIRDYLNDGKTVYLYSFCKEEGDENTIDQLLNNFKGNKNLKDIRYDGNIEAFLDIYGQMEYMICARFHSMILSCVANQKIQVISYNEKIDNVVDDLLSSIPLIKFENIKKDKKLFLEDFKTTGQELDNIIKDSYNQIIEFEKRYKL